MIGMNRPATITLLRHGEYFWNAAYHCNFKFESLDDVPVEIIDVEEQLVPLTPQGKEQAIATGHALAEMHPSGFDAIFYSPWLRVEETMELILACWKDEKIRNRMRNYCKEADDIAEQYQGDGVQFLDSAKRDEWEKQFKRLRLLLELKHRDFRKYRRHGLSTGDAEIDAPTHTGESHWQVKRRIGNFLQRLFVPHYHGKNVLVIGHLASIMWLRAALKHLKPQQVLADLNREDKKFAISNCGVCVFRWMDRDLPVEDHWNQEIWNKTFYEGAVLET